MSEVHHNDCIYMKTGTPNGRPPAASDDPSGARPPMRWRPAALILTLAILTIFYFRVVREDSQQWRNIYTMETCIGAVALLLLWVVFLSRLRWKIRLLVLASTVSVIGLTAVTLKIHGVTGDLIPIFKFRWSLPPSALAPAQGRTREGTPAMPASEPKLSESFPQFLGPNRNAMLPQGPNLARDWNAQPPKRLWRQPIGAGWSGFAVVGNRSLTQEQSGEDELVVCYELLTGKQPHVALPLVLEGDRVLVSSGYGVGSELLQIKRDDRGTFRAERLWKTNRLKAKFNNLVTRDGYVYGLDDGILACLEIASGDLKWKDGRYGHGQFILVQDVLLVTAENGQIALIDPVPTERRELTRFQALAGKTWNPPALAGDLLLVRNDQEAACYRLPVSQEQPRLSPQFRHL